LRHSSRPGVAAAFDDDQDHFRAVLAAAGGLAHPGGAIVGRRHVDQTGVRALVHFEGRDMVPRLEWHVGGGHKEHREYGKTHQLPLSMSLATCGLASWKPLTLLP